MIIKGSETVRSGCRLPHATQRWCCGVHKHLLAPGARTCQDNIEEYNPYNRDLHMQYIRLLQKQMQRYLKAIANRLQNALLPAGSRVHARGKAEIEEYKPHNTSAQAAETRHMQHMKTMQHTQHTQHTRLTTRYLLVRACTHVARPKSNSFSSPLEVKPTLSGLRSRWIMHTPARIGKKEEKKRKL
jgi:hypothetical protein